MILSMILAIAGATSVEKTYVDRMDREFEAGTSLLRSTVVQASDGSMHEVEVRLRPQGHDVYRMVAEEQPESWRQFVEMECALQGMEPSPEGGTLTGDAAVAGWSCRDSGEGTEGSDATEGSLRRALDYSIVVAPNGSAQVGQNFYATGLMKVQSSVGGKLSYEVSADNGRCRFGNEEHIRDPFDQVAFKRVICFAHYPATLSTAMRACVPKACGTDGGRYEIY